MINYQYLIDPFTKEISTLCISKLNDGVQISVIPNDPENTDWQAYQAWLAEGNTPLPPDA